MVDKQYILGLTQREVDSYNWRINSESKDPNYCGSTSFEHHLQQVRDPDSWVSESMLEAWEKEYIRDSEPQPTIKELQAKLDAVRKVYAEAGCRCVQTTGFGGIKAERETCPMCEIGKILNGENDECI